MRLIRVAVLGWYLFFYDGEAWRLFADFAYRTFDICHEQVERFNAAGFSAKCVEVRW